MDESVLHKICRFLAKQANNEAKFSSTFWQGTKQFYPLNQSKTKLKVWLKAMATKHPELVEIIKSEAGDPFGRIKLKTEVANSDFCDTTWAEDLDIVQKLIGMINNTAKNGHLYANICANKANIFPEQMQDKKYIKLWLTERENLFQMVYDQNGGPFSVNVLGEAIDLDAIQALPQAIENTKREKQTPKKKDESSGLLQMAADIEKRISGKITAENGTILFDSLLKAKDVIYPLSDSKALMKFLVAFPQTFEIIDMGDLGEWVSLIHQSNDYTAKDANDATIAKVASFIFEKGGIVPFKDLVKQSCILIADTINSQDALLAWLHANDKVLEILKPDNSAKSWQVKVKFSFLPRFCHDYVTKGQCEKKKCQFLHVCKVYVCKLSHDKCRLSHNIRDAHNSVIIAKMGVLNQESDDVVVNVLLKSCFPRVCLEYNTKGTCSKNENCHFLHICGNYVLNQCEHSPCLLNHDLAGSFHNLKLLKNYHLDKLSDDIVKANIAFAKVTKVPFNDLGVENIGMKLDKPEPAQIMEMKESHSQPRAKPKRQHRRGRGKKLGQASSTVDDISSENADTFDDEVDKLFFFSDSGKPSLLHSQNIKKSELGTPLTGNQKVGYWMGISVERNLLHGTYQRVDQEIGNPIKPECQMRSDSTSSSDMTYQSSVLSSQSTIWPDELVKKVFITLLEKHNGDVPFKQICKDKELFSKDVDVAKWFQNHRQQFILHYNGQGKIDSVSPFSRKARVCLDYSGNTGGCSDRLCKYLHICRLFVEGRCQRKKACHLNHNVGADQVQKAVKCMGLNDLSFQQLLTLIRVSLPSVCPYHNLQGGCKRGNFCPKLHLCKEFATRHQHCKRNPCKYGHEEALKNSHEINLLKMYHLYAKNPNFKYIQKMIFVFEKQRQGDAFQLRSENLGVRQSEKLRGLMDVQFPEKLDCSGILCFLFNMQSLPHICYLLNICKSHYMQEFLKSKTKR